MCLSVLSEGRPPTRAGAAFGGAAAAAAGHRSWRVAGVRRARCLAEFLLDLWKAVGLPLRFMEGIGPHGLSVHHDVHRRPHAELAANWGKHIQRHAPPSSLHAASIMKEGMKLVRPRRRMHLCGLVAHRIENRKPSDLGLIAGTTK
jgi:hypothetical protein